MCERKGVLQLSERHAYILVNNKKFWDRLSGRVAAGKKLYSFVRRGKVGPKNTELLFFYVTSPVREIQGFGNFAERVVGDADELWEKYGGETCLKSHEEYKDFLQGRKKATFIRLKNLQRLSNPISENTVCEIAGIARMPRGGRYINRETANQLLQRSCSF